MLSSGLVFCYDGFAPNRKSLGVINIKKTTQGNSEARDKVSPMVPAVDGMTIRMPDAKPITAIVLLNKGLRRMSTEIINNVTALNT